MKDPKFSAEVITIEDLSKINLYEIADYQRPFSWVANEQVADFISDLIRTFEENQANNEDHSLFIGTIYAKLLGTKLASSNKYELIDGQQRIITLALIFLSLYSFAAKEDSDVSSNQDIVAIKTCLWKYISRQYDRELNLISAGSIEKTLLKNLFNACYDNPTKFTDYIQKLNFENIIEKNLLDSVKLINRKIANKLIFCSNEKERQNWLLDFSAFLLRNVKIIFAVFELTRKNIFEMFESINSKGKHLDDIDLIKTYVFSQISEEDSKQYLQKWGILIRETEDNLEEYLAIYIKAFIKYYKQSIKIKVFKNLLDDKAIQTFYSSTDKAIILKKMIDDLVEKVGYYKALKDMNKFKTYISQKEISFHYNVFSWLEYEHPKPIIFKSLYEFDKSQKSKEDKTNFCNIFKYLNSFMILFQTFNNQESKDSIPTITKILTNSYSKDVLLNAEEIKEIIAPVLSSKINLSNFETELRKIDGYKDNATAIGFVLLTINEACDENLKFSHDKANAIFESRNKYSIDHLLPQNPQQNDINFKYYRGINETGVSVLRLKENHDFPSNEISDGMEYETFKNKILDKLGNLRLFPKDQNSSRQNNAIIWPLNGNKLFTTYSQIQENMNSLAQRILNSDVFFIPEKVLVIDAKEPEIQKQKTKTFILNFENLEQVTGHKPQFIEIYGESYQVKSTNELTQKVLEMLYNQDNLVFQKLLKDNSYGSLEHPWISQNSHILRRPQKIGDSNYFFETNKSAVDLLKIIKKIFIDNNKNLKDLKIVYEF